MTLRALRGLRVYLIMVVAGGHRSSAISRDTVLLRSASFADFAPSGEANKNGTATGSRDGLVTLCEGRRTGKWVPIFDCRKMGAHAKARSREGALALSAAQSMKAPCRRGSPRSRRYMIWL